jgi:hypothetical protein
MNSPAWLCETLHGWVCPEFCNAPTGKDCDTTQIAADLVMTELKTRIAAAVEYGYYKDHDIIWWLEQDDALAWREDGESDDVG